MDSDGVLFQSDFHVHCGQFYETYYEPEDVIRSLYENGIKEIWLSSTTSCIPWYNINEKAEIIRFIEQEINIVCQVAEELGMNVSPLYWVIPKRHKEGETVRQIMDGSRYRGFKVHPKANNESPENAYTDELFTEICQYASEKQMPILIHTGEDEDVSPNRFEAFFSQYPDVRFVLAHCKAPKRIIELMRKYSNVYGDTAFCPAESYRTICRAGFSDRMQRGTDFPITDWYIHTEKRETVSVGDLIEEYRQTLLSYQKLEETSG